MAGHTAMGSIMYGYEGNNMLVLFTPKGLMHLHRKIKRPSEKEEKEFERKGIPEEEIEKGISVTDKIITMEWVGANPDVEIIAAEETTGYHTYGLLSDKAYGYKKITYKNIYPGIDIIYHFSNAGKTGFEYSIVLQPGASTALIKMKYGGDTKSIQVNRAGNLVISSGIDAVTETMPVAFSNAAAEVKIPADKKYKQYDVSFHYQHKLVSFNLPVYDRSKTLIIDPFVSNTNTLGGANSGVAKDIDFDYAGNIYVAGGGSTMGLCQLAKYDPSGTLLWTFSGTLALPAWNWGIAYGGWVVEKGTGKVLIGQGVNTSGTRIIRLSAAGVYDNFITDANASFWENWKFLWSCNNGNPQILIAGGGIISNINLAVCSPPATTLSSINLTGIPTNGQDIADLVVDPFTNDMYSIFASSFLTPMVNNRIYKNAAPYNASTITWQAPSGFTIMNEAKNRPYLSAVGDNDNSMNILAVNSSFLFYWDGLNLKAFNKADGTTAGTPLILAGNTAKMQGGIIADECNNIFIGNTNGTIKVYKFDGVSFDDAAAADISIPGYSAAPVYDLAYDEARRLLYASGAGFVAAFDISSYCVSNIFNLTAVIDCPTLSAQANITPVPPVGTTVSYALFAGSTQIATNSTGSFNGLAPGINYTIKAFLNQACSGSQLIQNFTMDACSPVIAATFINPSCNLSNGSIDATASFGTQPYQFSLGGINFQPGGLFTGLSAGSYSVIVKDANNYRDTIDIILVNSLPLQLSTTTTASSCIQNDGTVNATGSGGAAPLKYSIDGIVFGPSGIFTGLAPGNYSITVKDTNNCIVVIPAVVGSLNTVVANAGSNATICEGDNTTLAAVSNGSSFLWTPATGLSNPNILNPLASPVITTVYTLTAQTGLCKATSSVTVFVKPAPVPDAGNDTGACTGKDVQLNGSGGFSYTWSPATYLSATNIPNPVVLQAPTGSYFYQLSAIGSNGCASLKDAVVKVTISTPAKLFVGNDTVIAINQPLQLHGIDVNNSGFNNYTWSPAYGLNDPSAKDPVAILNRDVLYSVFASNAFGCSATDDIKIKVYEGPEIYVPNAFTPGGDGLNDVLTPVVIGMKAFHYFSVFNNFGQLVYTTADASKGWDGNFKNSRQPQGTYVWMAEAVDYRGNIIQRNGSVILIR